MTSSVCASEQYGASWHTLRSSVVTLMAGFLGLVALTYRRYVPLSLGFLICEMATLTVPTSYGQ